MDKYKIGNTLGDGTFGTVFLAINELTGEQVAIKKMKQKKFKRWDEITSMAEIESLQQLRHPNIIELKEVIKKNNELYLVFEYVHINVYQLIKERSEANLKLEPTLIRNIMFQTLQAVAYIHDQGYFHRDLKPENLLYNLNTEEVKVADLGLAKSYHSSSAPQTDYVSTRWYRAPELILRTKKYGPAIDMFALGCIMAELFLFWPLFPGVNERDMIDKMGQAMSGFSAWREGVALARRMGLDYKVFSEQPQHSLPHLFKKLDPLASELLQAMLRWDPKSRITAREALQHPYFSPHLYGKTKQEAPPQRQNKKTLDIFGMLRHKA